MEATVPYRYTPVHGPNYCCLPPKVMQHTQAITAHLVEISVLLPFRLRHDCSFREVQVISEPFPCNNLLSTQARLAVRQR